MMIPAMATPVNHHGTTAGTVGGTLLTIAVSIPSGDIVKTIILAAVGAVVSFVMSLALKWIVKSFRPSR